MSQLIVSCHGRLAVIAPQNRFQAFFLQMRFELILRLEVLITRSTVHLVRAVFRQVIEHLKETKLHLYCFGYFNMLVLQLCSDLLNELGWTIVFRLQFVEIIANCINLTFFSLQVGLVLRALLNRTSVIFPSCLHFTCLTQDLLAIDACL